MRRASWCLLLLHCACQQAAEAFCVCRHVVDTLGGQAAVEAIPLCPIAHPQSGSLPALSLQVSVIEISELPCYGQTLELAELLPDCTGTERITWASRHGRCCAAL